MQELARKYAQRTVEVTYNAIEPVDPEESPHYVQQGTTIYRRVNEPTANRHVATLFGKITLHRRGYRDIERDSGEPMIFPLECQRRRGPIPEWRSQSRLSAMGGWRSSGGPGVVRRRDVV